MILSFCNIQLIRALRESQRIRKQMRVQRATAPSSSMISPTLIALIAMFLILVTPSELVNITVFYLDRESLQMLDMNLLIEISNLMHTANFSVNFFLYCIVNSHFRQTLKVLVCCCCEKEGNRQTQSSASRTTSYTHVKGYKNRTQETETML